MHGSTNACAKARTDENTNFIIWHPDRSLRGRINVSTETMMNANTGGNLLERCVKARTPAWKLGQKRTQNLVPERKPAWKGERLHGNHDANTREGNLMERVEAQTPLRKLGQKRTPTSEPKRKPTWKHDCQHGNLDGREH